MRGFTLPLLIVVTSVLITASEQQKQVKSPIPLSADEIAIYKAVLQKYASSDSEPVNVSLRTFPLDSTSPIAGLSAGDCAKLQMDNLSSVAHTFHDLTDEVLPDKSMKLVDPKKQAKVVHANDPSKTIREGKSVDAAVRAAFSTGLFSMSEIAFDKDHRRAIVSYSFWCGSLCGHGSTLIFEKGSDGWHKTGAECGGWVS